MSIAQIKAFSEQAKTDPELKAKLLEVQKIRELIALGKEYNYELDEVELYPPNEPQFVEEQLSERMAKALLRAKSPYLGSPTIGCPSQAACTRI